MKWIQVTQITFSTDIKEAFFRITLHEDSVNSLIFLMAFNSQTNQLTAKQGPKTKLVTIRCLVTVMEILQYPWFQGLCREDLAKDIKDKILTYFLKDFSYLIDLQTAITSKELSALQQSVNLEENTNVSMYENTRCCPTYSVEPLEEALGPTTPEDKVRGFRHLMQGPFGKQLFRMVIFALPD